MGESNNRIGEHYQIQRKLGEGDTYLFNSKIDLNAHLQKIEKLATPTN